MLDPVIDWIKARIAALAALILGIARGVAGAFRTLIAAMTFRSPDPKAPLPFASKVKRALGTVVLLVVAGWYGSYFWHAATIRGYSMLYPQTLVKPTEFRPGKETTQPESGTAQIRSCGRSQLVDMETYLIRFLIEDNKFVPSMIQHKLGFFGIPWDDTPVFDRKSMFQKGVMRAVRRISIEMVDTLGRVRGTSQADPDLEHARGLLSYDMETWWINPFDSKRPFGPVSPSDEVYAKAITAFEAYNGRLAKCDALFDARRDNLSQLLDRVSKDLGSTVDALAKRSRSEVWDPRANKFVPAEGNDRGFFDLKADGMFWEALGEAYAYHGLLQAAREDMSEAVSNFRLNEIWDQTESHIAESISLWPTLVSNGAEDGLLMPAHLTSLAHRILRARANMVEMRDILSR